MGKTDTGVFAQSSTTQVDQDGVSPPRNVRVKRFRKGKEKASNSIFDQDLNIISSDDDQIYLPKISFKRPFSPLGSNFEHEGSRALNKSAKSGNEIYFEGISNFNRLAKIQIKEKEEKVNLATSINLAKVAIKELHLPDPELEMDLMECLLNDTFRALFLTFDLFEKFQWVERMRKKWFGGSWCSWAIVVS
ncbi:hypothetical protein ACH5RR_008134 [Cinchona calisaya]|uniref:Uncharacterized protein n=1 Tax=Cinchona calisaya TaxID=153742 RepID=A0ABD3AEC1_9GENT